MTAPPPFPYLQKTFMLGQVDDMARAIREDGFALVPDVLSPDEVAALREATDRLRPFGLDHSTPVPASWISTLSTVSGPGP